MIRDNLWTSTTRSNAFLKTYVLVVDVGQNSPVLDERICTDHVAMLHLGHDWFNVALQQVLTQMDNLLRIVRSQSRQNKLMSTLPITVLIQRMSISIKSMNILKLIKMKSYTWGNFNTISTCNISILTSPVYPCGGPGYGPFSTAVHRLFSMPVS